MSKSTSTELDLHEPIVTGNMKAAIKLADGKSSDLWQVPYSSLHYDPRDNIRPLDLAHVRQVADLIKANDYDPKSPLGAIVKKIDGRDLIYVYAGQHRFHGAVLAIEEGWRPKDWKPEDGPVRLPVVIDAAKGVSRSSIIIAGVNSNNAEPVSALDLAGAIADLRREGLIQTEICRALGITDQTVRDVAVLAAAPAEIHALVRAKTVAATLAIEEIRKHGPDKALERLQQGAELVAQGGKTRVTRKALPKTTERKFTLDQSKLLLQALQAVVMDPAFTAVKERAKIIVNEALRPFNWQLENDGKDLLKNPPHPPREFPIVAPNEHGAFPPSGLLTLKVKGRIIAQIRLSQFKMNGWVMSTAVTMRTCGRSSAPSLSDVEQGVWWSDILVAVQAGVSEIQRFINESDHKKLREYPHISRWLDQIFLARLDIDDLIEIPAVGAVDA